MPVSAYTLKPMTDSSWILQKDGVRLALVTSKDGALKTIGKLDRSDFKDIKDLEKFLACKIEIEQPDEDSGGDEVGNIEGYPIKHQAVLQSESDMDLPTYKRGKTEHAAGYYGVKFKHGWVTSYCPKLTTLIENEYIGPFRSKLEMLNAISQKKRTFDL